MCVVLAALLTDSVKMRVNAVEYFFISGYQEKNIKLGLSFAVVDTIFVPSNFFTDILGTNNAKPSIQFPKGPDPNRKKISFCCPPDSRSKKVAANKGKRRRRLLLPMVFFPTEFGTSFTFLPDQECSSQLQKSQQAPAGLEMCRIWARVEKNTFS